MKVSSSVFNENYGKPSSKAILPLEPVKDEEVASNQMITYTLRSAPGDDNSPKYKVTINILQGDEDCRPLLGWHKKVHQILTGLNVTTMGPAIPIVGTLMVATPGALFNDSVAQSKERHWQKRVLNASSEDAANDINDEGPDHANNAHFDHIKNGLKNVIKQLLPQRVLARVKRYI